MPSSIQPCSGPWACRPRRGGDPRVDPPDQHDAPPADGVGGDGVPAGQPEEAPHLGHPQATAAAVAADGGRRGGRADGGPAAAAEPVGQSAGRHAHPSHRAVGRQLLDVRPLGRHRRLLGGQEGRPAHRRRRRPAGPAPVVHAVAVLAGGRPQRRRGARPAQSSRSAASSPTSWKRCWPRSRSRRPPPARCRRCRRSPSCSAAATASSASSI